MLIIPKSAGILMGSFIFFSLLLIIKIEYDAMKQRPERGGDEDGKDTVCRDERRFGSVYR